MVRQHIKVAERATLERVLTRTVTGTGKTNVRPDYLLSPINLIGSDATDSAALFVAIALPPSVSSRAKYSAKFLCK